MKIFATFFLLTAIAFSLQFYFANAEDHSENLTTLVTPITIVTLLLLIYFFSPQKTKYRKVFGILLIISSILSVLLFAAFCYVVQLGKAFSH
jgi:Na+-driven multidrug efflux pump